MLKRRREAGQPGPALQQLLRLRWACTGVGDLLLHVAYTFIFSDFLDIQDHEDQLFFQRS